MKLALDYWHELWEEAGSRGLDTWHEPQHRGIGREEDSYLQTDGADDEIVSCIINDDMGPPA